MRKLRAILTAALTGALIVGAAWAGIGLVPVDVQTPADDVVAEGTSTSEGSLEEAKGQGQASGFQAGAAKVSIYPDPDAYGGTWKKEGCAVLEDPNAYPEHGNDLRMPWAEDSECIYTGGYGIGPVNPVTEFDTEYGLWSRSVALSDGTDTVVLTILDATYYFAEYERLCDGCGFDALAAELGEDLGIPADNFVFASSHSHNAPDFIGGWGGVPTWYMEQVADAMRTSVTEAVEGLEPAVLEAGEVLAREHNRERRDTYFSAEDETLDWFRVREAHPGGKGDTIATVGGFAAHPTTVDPEPWIAHPDWPGLFEKQLEERFGGVGLYFMTGLGNMSAVGGTHVGVDLADLVPDEGEGTVVTPDVSAAKTSWNHPVTNSGLLTLGLAKVFDRPFEQTPATIEVGKSPNDPCRSAAPISVRTSVSAIKVGDLVITAAPGETFANLSNTIEERSIERFGSVSVLPIGVANDGLGYIMQSFETDHAGRQGLGFVGGPDDSAEPVVPEGAVVEYEDAYSIDHCFGDAVLHNTLDLLNQL